ncbi:E3 ubiquitin-protein ligase RNF8 isoform X2 [Bicyclus anynana]|uniref:E3 ubiquitin-protein ligase CHFR n=1 Tax=Bicyclus anynana TaxID=110368 RepID=A0A6J1P407_BICAN|nr:E3 ubiquitin-protein ligase RNF8 isoform X2 [Bicyclus anynana]
MQEIFPTLVSCKPLQNDFKCLQQIVVNSEKFTIGRGPHNNLNIPYLAISRNHCNLIKNDNNWILEDHSTFGLYINGVKLGKGNRKQVNHHDVITLDDSKEFVYKFLNEDAQLMPSSVKRIKLEPEEDHKDIINDMKMKFEESQNHEMKHIEHKIENTKHIKTTNMILKEQLQLDMKREIKKLEKECAAKIENLKGEKNEVERQKVLLIQERDTQLATLKENMERKIAELMEQIRKHTEIESELIVENNLLKEKMLKEREEFLSELNRESSLKQDMLNKLEAKMKEQEEVRLKEKQEFELILQKETEQLRLAKEKEVNELVEQKKQKELELMEELKNIKKNLEEQEMQKLEVQQQYNNHLDEIQKTKESDKLKLEQMHTKLNEAQENAQKAIEDLKKKIADREVELKTLAVERIKQQAEQSSEVISSLQDQLEKVRNQLHSVESENVKLLQNTTDKMEGTSKQTLTEFGEIMESELQCSICAELFVSAIVLNCSHTFCKYCITMWKKKKAECPICRTLITSESKSLVLDSFIEKMVQNLTEEMKQKRKDMLQSREDEVARMDQKETSNTSRRRRNQRATRNTRTTRRYTTTTPATRNTGMTLEVTPIPTVDLTSISVYSNRTRANPIMLQELVPEEVIIVGQDIEVGYQVGPAPTTAATGDASPAALAATGLPGAHYAATSVHNTNQFY